ncbi:hypothetical protein IX92_06545 [Vibrio coralliilyticus]|uniref:Uncharacterized protein n=1 Tax=Vibrio coralliilyticus TaxID=190893 RepID=A0AAN0VWT6_9VIBR|nr:hypothetical protein IX92_06545 [Vibrio coralliilyticus]
MMQEFSFRFELLFCSYTMSKFYNRGSKMWVSRDISTVAKQRVLSNLQYSKACFYFASCFAVYLHI